MRILAIANQKGGVGKTTTCVNLACALAEAKRRVLLIDLDPQGNATMGCGVDSRSADVTAGDVLLGDVSVTEAAIERPELGFALIPANTSVTAAEVHLFQKPEREMQLRGALRAETLPYQHVLIDCPPSLSLLTVNALAAADAVLIPMQCEYYALEGLSALLDTVERIKKRVNPDLRVEGLLRTMFDSRNNLSNEVSSQLVRHFGDKVYNTIVPRNVRVAEAPSFGEPVIRYDRSSRGSLAYLGVATELLRRERQSAGAAHGS